MSFIDKSFRKIIATIVYELIGHLQRNKINKIIKLPGLHMIQTIDSEKLAEVKLLKNRRWKLLLYFYDRQSTVVGSRIDLKPMEN